MREMKPCQAPPRRGIDNLTQKICTPVQEEAHALSFASFTNPSPFPPVSRQLASRGKGLSVLLHDVDNARPSVSWVDQLGGLSRSAVLYTSRAVAVGGVYATREGGRMPQGGADREGTIGGGHE